MKFHLPQLPWSVASLEPFLSEDQVKQHYFGHHRAYIDKLNELIAPLEPTESSLEQLILHREGKLYSNAAQAWNHTFYWLGLTPTSSTPGRLTQQAILAQQGSLEALQKEFMASAMAIFGSGWTWLVVDEDAKISLVNTHDGDNTLRHENAWPIWACDVWEHAYYIDYRGRREAYLEGAWHHINWEFVEENLKALRIPNMSRWMLDTPASAPPPAQSHV